MQKWGLRYYISYGGLIGWYRHNQSFIPVGCFVLFKENKIPKFLLIIQWDDDVDVAVLTSNWQELEYFAEKFTNAWPDSDHSMYYMSDNYRIKCYSNTTGHVVDEEGKYGWKYPFVDLQFMLLDVSEDGDHVNVVDAAFKYKFPLDIIYPLQKAQLEGIDVYVPKNPFRVLDINYYLNRCRQNSG